MRILLSTSVNFPTNDDIPYGNTSFVMNLKFSLTFRLQLIKLNFLVFLCKIKIMKIKTFSFIGPLFDDGDNEVNEFLQGKKVIDVKITTYATSEDDEETNTVLVIYE